MWIFTDCGQHGEVRSSITQVKRLTYFFFFFCLYILEVIYMVRIGQYAAYKSIFDPCSVLMLGPWHLPRRWHSAGCPSRQGVDSQQHWLSFHLRNLLTVSRGAWDDSHQSLYCDLSYTISTNFLNLRSISWSCKNSIGEAEDPWSEEPFVGGGLTLSRILPFATFSSIWKEILWLSYTFRLFLP